MLTAAKAAVFGEAIPTDDETFEVSIHQGQMIRLNKDAASVFIANPEVADVSVKSARLVYVFGKAPGVTSLFAVDARDNLIANVKIVVTHNVSRLQEALDKLLPDDDVTATSIDGAILLTGTVATGIAAENARRLAERFIGKNEAIINQIGIYAPNQVNLRVRIAEVSREIVNQFGLNWTAAFSSSNFDFAFQSVTPVDGTNLLGIGGTPGNWDINALIDALAEDNLVSVLAEPNLTALSGETASFLAGGEFPIPVAESDDRITVVFKEFGVSLAFTPTLVGTNKISMRVRPEVSQLSNEASVTFERITLPSLTTRRAETTVELNSGQSFAIAGLILDNTRQNASKVPGLGDIPILGHLFQSDRFQRNETELVIIVTPYIVRPVNPDQLQIPNEPLQYPQDENAPLVSEDSRGTQTVPLHAAEVPSGSSNKNVGFIVE
ncbi:MAG: type II and III secretion system protein family protein [Pseudomonadota bacterium]